MSLAIAFNSDTVSAVTPNTAAETAVSLYTVIIIVNTSAMTINADRPHAIYAVTGTFAITAHAIRCSAAAYAIPGCCKAKYAIRPPIANHAGVA